MNVLDELLETKGAATELTCRKANLVGVKRPPGADIPYALQSNDPEQHYRAQEASREQRYPGDI